MGDIPVLGDWNADGRTKIGIFRNGLWVLDLNGNGVPKYLGDGFYGFGMTGDKPVTGIW